MSIPCAMAWATYWSRMRVRIVIGQSSLWMRWLIISSMALPWTPASLAPDQRGVAHYQRSWKRASGRAVSRARWTATQRAVSEMWVRYLDIREM